MTYLPGRTPSFLACRIDKRNQEVGGDGDRNRGARKQGMHPSRQDTSGTRPKSAREHKLAFHFLPFESPATKLYSQAPHGLVRLMGIIVAVDTPAQPLNTPT